MNHPSSPAITATTLPAISAFTMKWYSSTSFRSCTGFHVRCGLMASVDMFMAIVVMRRRFRLAHDDKPPIRGAQHLHG